MSWKNVSPAIYNRHTVHHCTNQIWTIQTITDWTTLLTNCGRDTLTELESCFVWMQLQMTCGRLLLTDQ